MPGPPKGILYLAAFDPTVCNTGSAVRGRLGVRSLADRFDLHLVHLRQRHREGRDEELIGRLASCASVEYSALGYFLFSPALLRRAAAVLRNHPIDLIVAEFDKSGLYAWLLTRFHRVPYLYASHNAEFRRYLNQARATPARLLFVPYLWLAERLACKGARSTMAISEEDARVFRRWVPHEKVMVAQYAFDEEEIHPFSAEERADGRPIVLMVGNYRNGGNREAARRLVEEIAPAVRARHPHAVFRFVGRDFPEDLHRPWVEPAGFVQDLLAEYRRATVVAAPITMGGGIKIKVVEALASGSFLVATPKAMEGMETAGLEHLAITPVDQFAEAVAAALDRRPGHSAHNWPRIVRTFGCRHQTRLLQERIAAILNENVEKESHALARKPGQHHHSQL